MDDKSQIRNLVLGFLLEGEQRGWTAGRLAEEIAESVTENFELLPHASVEEGEMVA